MSHGELAARSLLGSPYADIHDQLGALWPTLGWIGALAMWRGASRAGGSASRFARWIGTSLAAWVALHVLVFGSYFYPAPRFYLGPCALVTLGFAVGCGLVAASAKTWGLPTTACVLVALLALGLPRPKLLGGPAEAPDPSVPRKVARWLSFTDKRRSHMTVPFDPVMAQALGLLPPPVVARIGSWGKLPLTDHVVRLAGRGMIPSEAIQKRRPSRLRRRSEGN